MRERGGKEEREREREGGERGTVGEGGKGKSCSRSAVDYETLQSTEPIMI